MKRSRFSEEQIIVILREQETGQKAVDVCCRYGISNATFYKWKARYGGLEVSDAKRLKGLEDENTRLKKLLAREGIVLNHKKFRRLYREEKLQMRRRGGREEALGARAPLGFPDGPDQRWSLDFVFDALSDGRRFRILAIVDDFTRESLALVAETSLSSQRVARELEGLISRREAHRRTVVSDDCRELTGMVILHWSQDRCVESFNGRLRDECLNETRFGTLGHARAVLSNWKEDYNTVRPHSSLAGRTPSEIARPAGPGHAPDLLAIT